MNKKIMRFFAVIIFSALSVFATAPASAESEENTQTSSVIDSVYSEYADFLQIYKEAQDNYFYHFDLGNPAIENINPELLRLPNVELYYTLVDLAHDGIPEMFIASSPYSPNVVNDYGWRNGGYWIYDTYGYDGSQGSRLFSTYSMGYRSNYSIMDGDVLLCAGSGGAFNNVTEYYTLPANSASPQMFRFIEYDGFDGTNKWYLGTGNYDDKQLISPSYRDSLLHQYSYKSGSDFVWHPIGDIDSLWNELNANIIPVYVNGVQIDFDQQPIIQNDRALVPLRGIFEALGADVYWDSASRSIISSKNGTNLIMTIGSNTMYKNGVAQYLDVPPQIINDRTMVPVRVIAESFDCDVLWNSDSSIEITEK